MNKSIVFLAPDAEDAAVERRVSGLDAAGMKVSAFAYIRRASANGIKPLGTIKSGIGPKRVWVILRAILKQKMFINKAAPEFVLARNIDLLFLAYLAAFLSRRRPHIFYEVLDVHEALSGTGIKAQVLRLCERLLILRVSGIITSSPSFERNYFRNIQNVKTPIFLLENKLEPSSPLSQPPMVPLGSVVTICFNGKIRCRQSLDLLHRIAERFPKQVALKVSGTPNAGLEVPFEKLFCLPNVTGHGRYCYPDDLSKIYAGAHLNWAIDLQTDFNSKNLIPNRIYEGAAFGVPPLVLVGSATADFVASWECGIPLSGDIEAALVELILNGRPQIEAALSAVRRLPQSHFIHEHTYLDLLDFMNDNSTSPPASINQPR